MSARAGIARRGLVLAIRGYRRWLSGRGPMRRVRCTFHDGESCSAFGLRAAQEAPSMRIALGRIRRRIRRCGDVALFALDAPDGTRALGWGADHERPVAELDAELIADGEGDAVRAQILSAREVAARWRQDLGEAAQARVRRGDAAPVRPQLRRVPSLALLARALAWRAVVAAVVVAAVATSSPRAAAVLAALALLPLAAITRRHVARRARLGRQARSALLREPDGRDGMVATRAAPT